MKVVLAIIWALVSTSVYPVLTQAQVNGQRSNSQRTPNKPNQSNQTTNSWQARGKGPPGPPGGKRGGCPNMQKHLTALVPVTQESDKEYRGGYTTKKNPNFWFYVPYVPKNITFSKFLLLNQNGLTEYESDVSITEAAGVIAIPLPNKVNLKSGEWYQSNLSLKVVCNDGSIKQDEVYGWVRMDVLNAKIKPNLPLHQQFAIYVEKNIWFDALDVAAELKRKNPNDDNLNQLFKSAGLETIVGESIVKYP